MAEGEEAAMEVRRLAAAAAAARGLRKAVARVGRPLEEAAAAATIVHEHGWLRQVVRPAAACRPCPCPR